MVPFGDESVYDVLWAHTVVIERSALEVDSNIDGSEDEDLKPDSSDEEADNA